MTGRVAVVTGASGFLGRHVIEHLGHAGWHVRAVTRRPEVVRADEVIEWRDFADEVAIGSAMRGADVVVHLAAHVHVFAGSSADRQGLARANVNGATVVARAAGSNGVRRVLFVSSVAARDDQQPHDMYGASKRDAESSVFECLDRTDTEIIIVRPPMVYGEGMKGRPLRLFQLIARGVPIPVPGSSNLRSVAYAGNVAASISFLIGSGASLPGSPIYPADSDAMSTAELVRAIAMALGRKPVVISVPRLALDIIGGIGSATRRRVIPVNLEDVRRAFGTLVVDTAGAFPDGAAPFTTAAALQRTARWFSGEAP